MAFVRSQIIGATTLLFCGLAPLAASAAAPDLKTPAPVIYLADNLDEKDNLGWCIDTLGRGFAEQLQAHSCKPQGGDVQFIFDIEAGQIASAEFAGKCATRNDSPQSEVTFDLLDCKADDPAQKFTYDADLMTFHPLNDESLCLIVGAASRSAGPFMSRSLDLSPCAEVEPNRKEWVIVE